MIYQFNDFQLNTSNFSLEKLGQRIDVEPQVFNLLVFLIENKERLVTRNEIFQNLWSDKQVLDATLSNHIKIARNIMGDDGKSQIIIRTLRGRGYQFVAEVKEIQDTPNDKIQEKTKSSSLKYLVVLVLISLGIFTQIERGSNQQYNQKTNLIAVLPFLNGKPNPSTDYLGLAIADQIIGNLAYLRNIDVRPSSIVRKYSKQLYDPQEIGKQLDVDYVITGTYLNTDKKINFNLELFDVETSKLIWRLNNVPFDFLQPGKLQDLIRKKVSEGINLESSISTVTKYKQPNNVLAYEYYLKSISQPFSTKGHKTAIALLEKSIAIDDRFAPAYSQLGNRIKRYEQYGLKHYGESLKPFQYYQKALSLDSELLSALSYLTFYYCETNRLNEAAVLANRIIQINPDSAASHFTLGYVYRYGGLIEKAINEMEKAVKIDPKNIRYRSLVATYSGVGDFEKVSELIDTYNTSSFTTAWNGLLRYRLGNFEESLDYFRELITEDPNSFWGLVSKIHLYLVENKMDEGLLAIHKLEQTNTTDSETVFYIAVYYGMYKDKIRSLNALKKSVYGGYYNYVFMLNSPFFDFMRDDTEFRNILELAQSKSRAFKSFLRVNNLNQTGG